jgi:hypothetical protein
MFKGEGGQAAGNSAMALHSAVTTRFLLCLIQSSSTLSMEAPIYILFLGILGSGKIMAVKHFAYFLFSMHSRNWARKGVVLILNEQFEPKPEDEQTESQSDEDENELETSDEPTGLHAAKMTENPVAGGEIKDGMSNDPAEKLNPNVEKRAAIKKITTKQSPAKTAPALVRTPTVPVKKTLAKKAPAKTASPAKKTAPAGKNVTTPVKKAVPGRKKLTPVKNATKSTQKVVVPAKKTIAPAKKKAVKAVKKVAAKKAIKKTVAPKKAIKKTAVKKAIKKATKKK